MFTSDVPIPTISTQKATDGRINRRSQRFNDPPPPAGRSWHNTHHVGSVDGGGHLDFPEVMAVGELLGAADGSRAAAVVGMETHLPVVAAEEGSRGLEVVVPLPLKLWRE